jgi:hypothetical protein
MAGCGIGTGMVSASSELRTTGLVASARSALEAFNDLDAPDTLELLAEAPDRTSAARLSEPLPDQPPRAAGCASPDR